jgi:hypothetical protein
MAVKGIKWVPIAWVWMPQVFLCQKAVGNALHSCACCYPIVVLNSRLWQLEWITWSRPAGLIWNTAQRVVRVHPGLQPWIKENVWESNLVTWCTLVISIYLCFILDRKFNHDPCHEKWQGDTLTSLPSPTPLAQLQIFTNLLRFIFCGSPVPQDWTVRSALVFAEEVLAKVLL